MNNELETKDLDDTKEDIEWHKKQLAFFENMVEEEKISIKKLEELLVRLMISD